ncbi:transcriptional regulator [Pseudomonas sp. FW215-R2]|uniref:LysR family transcriptional regulator n=1 Tax=unclassified Pseudomonas TaxID=196821 RepID=UPI000C88A76F|nr:MULTISPECIES: LysR family transcriptional regulator [unclassified Pseudomonas]PMX02493.1 transcriptional regulator [Pseudomonas sp. FW215-R2]PMX11179.1 transcriptional regulator [Pseudomonas sp. FW215-L1]PMX23224.1 transcriptional regulator [Pseudomonas sp. FW215-E1]PNA30064.1 transcriptional regulator [Pseudomonas sp. FW215-R4]
MDRLAAMETFVYVVETGSFSAAARRLNIGQPAVSKTIAQLETRLAVRLLLRSTRGLTPTEAGLAFFERAKRTLEEADEADNAARGAASGLSGNLRISTAVTFGRMHVVPHLGPFLDQHPQLNVDLLLDDQNINLVEEGIDIALRLGPLSDSGLTVRKIAECRRVVLGTPAYFASHGEPACPADLPQHRAVIYNRGGGATWHFNKDGEEQSVTVNGRLRVSAAEGLREAVLAHQGLGLGSEWMFAPELASGAVKAVMSDWVLPKQELWAVFPTGRMASAKARAFVEYVQGVLAEMS